MPGAAWAGSFASLGDLNVYSNGPSLSMSAPGPYGGQYQCTELAHRWLAIRWGEPNGHLGEAASWWDNGPSMPVPLVQHPNGGADGPQFGDIIVFGATSFDTTGHVAVVIGATATGVTVVEQNWSATAGRATIPISGTTMPPRWGLPILGWLRPTPRPYVANASGPGGYAVDGYGGVHPWGSAPWVASGAYWPGWDIARGIVRQPGKNAGYVLDGFGGLTPFGGAAPVSITGYWPGRDLARGAAIRADGKSGYVLDAFGGLHPFGGAPYVAVSGYWPNWDIARGVALRSDGTSGWVVDGFGGLHPFGGAPGVSGTGYWSGWDIVRGIAVVPGTDSGYVLDAYGPVHAFGAARALNTSFTFPSSNDGVGIVMTASGGSGGGTSYDAYIGYRNGTVATTSRSGNVPFDQAGLPINHGIA